MDLHRAALLTAWAAVVAHVAQLVNIATLGAARTSSGSGSPARLAIGYVLSATILAGIWAAGQLLAERGRSRLRGLLALLPIIGFLVLLDAISQSRKPSKEKIDGQRDV